MKNHCGWSKPPPICPETGRENALVAANGAAVSPKSEPWKRQNGGALWGSVGLELSDPTSGRAASGPLVRAYVADFPVHFPKGQETCLLFPDFRIIYNLKACGLGEHCGWSKSPPICPKTGRENALVLFPISVQFIILKACGLAALENQPGGGMHFSEAF